MRNDYSGNESTLVPGRLRGYRTWELLKYLSGDFRLSSISADYAWKRGDQTAECRKNPPNHKAPGSDCTCGFYAKYQPRYLEVTSFTNVIGAIDAWGTIQLGLKGFRAQHARIAAIAPSYHFYDEVGHVKILSQVYGVDYFPTVESLTAAYPMSDLSEILPQEEPVSLWEEIKRTEAMIMGNPFYKQFLINDTLAKNYLLGLM